MLPTGSAARSVTVDSIATRRAWGLCMCSCVDMCVCGCVQGEGHHHGLPETDGEEAEGPERHPGPGEEPVRGAERPGKASLHGKAESMLLHTFTFFRRISSV